MSMGLASVVFERGVVCRDRALVGQGPPRNRGQAQTKLDGACAPGAPHSAAEIGPAHLLHRVTGTLEGT